MIYLYILLSCEWKGFCMFFYYYCCCSWYMFYMNFLTVWYLFMRKCLSVCWSKTERKKNRFVLVFVLWSLGWSSIVAWFFLALIWLSLVHLKFYSVCLKGARREVMLRLNGLSWSWKMGASWIYVYSELLRDSNGFTRYNK